MRLKTKKNTPRFKYAVIFFTVSIAISIASPGAFARDSIKEDYEKWKTFYEKKDYTRAIPHLEKIIRDIEGAWVQKPISDIEARIEKYRRRIKREKVIGIVANTGISYTDNLYNVSNDPTPTFLSKTTAGVNLDIGSGPRSITGKYTSSYYSYFNASDQNRFDHYLDTALKIDDFYVLDSNKSFARKIGLTVGNKLHPGTFRPSIEDRDYRSILDNNAYVELDYPFTPKTSMGFLYDNFIRYNFDSAYREFDHQKHLLGGRLYYHVTPKTKFFGSYDYGRVHYTHKGDYESFAHRLHGGIKGALTKKSAINLSVGAEYLEYFDNPDISDRFLFTMDGSLSSDILPRTSLMLYARRGVNESIFQDHPYYVQSSFGGSLKYKIGNFAFYGGLNLMFADYQSISTAGDQLKKRRDIHYSPNIGLQYDINKWISFDLDYAYKFTDSNIDDYQYVENIVQAEVRSRF